MDQNGFIAYREKVGATLTHRLNDAYAQGAISEDETPIVAQFILDHIDKTTNHAELIALIEELSNKWPLFGPVLVAERSQQEAENISKQENQAVTEVENLLKENKIDEALATAEHANQDSEAASETQPADPTDTLPPPEPMSTDTPVVPPLPTDPQSQDQPAEHQNTEEQTNGIGGNS